ncbi:unnamed protein product [Vitrella brassicaformis CCMP3155]|uniref:Uncharacterized protein n=1 Tax=Vitrella brassicaformis (strain CCMP3155) TaxID=1169540 RepID=A0A0G4FPT9_VITBC|nr:unnamed protein product [Vitrella brassicaformis CCMP3155]|eukprot:CEM16478.1 unnamed protein product [Vitrella brassicaformis CCMP3155]
MKEGHLRRLPREVLCAVLQQMRGFAPLAVCTPVIPDQPCHAGDPFADDADHPHDSSYHHVAQLTPRVISASPTAQRPRRFKSRKNKPARAEEWRMVVAASAGSSSSRELAEQVEAASRRNDTSELLRLHRALDVDTLEKWDLVSVMKAFSRVRALEASRFWPCACDHLLGNGLLVELSPLAMGFVMNALAKVPRAARNHPLLDALCGVAAARLSEFPPSALTMVLAGLAQRDHRTRESISLFVESAKRAGGMLGAFKVAELTQLLNAFARMEVVAHHGQSAAVVVVDLFALASSRLAGSSERLNALDVFFLCNSFRRLSMSQPHEQDHLPHEVRQRFESSVGVLFGRLSQRIRQGDVCGELTPQSIADIASAFARYRPSDMRLFRTLAERTKECHTSFDQKAAALLLVALCEVSYYDPCLRMLMSRQLLKHHVGNKNPIVPLSGSMLAQVAHACSKMGQMERYAYGAAHEWRNDSSLHPWSRASWSLNLHMTAFIQGQVALRLGQFDYRQLIKLCMASLCSPHLLAALPFPPDAPTAPPHMALHRGHTQPSQLQTMIRVPLLFPLVERALGEWEKTATQGRDGGDAAAGGTERRSLLTVLAAVQLGIAEGITAAMRRALSEEARTEEQDGAAAGGGGGGVLLEAGVRESVRRFSVWQDRRYAWTEREGEGECAAGNGAVCQPEADTRTHIPAAGVVGVGCLRLESLGAASALIRSLGDAPMRPPASSAAHRDVWAMVVKASREIEETTHQPCVVSEMTAGPYTIDMMVVAHSRAHKRHEVVPGAVD